MRSIFDGLSVLGAKQKRGKEASKNELRYRKRGSVKGLLSNLAGDLPTTRKYDYLGYSCAYKQYV